VFSKISNNIHYYIFNDTSSHLELLAAVKRQYGVSVARCERAAGAAPFVA
jgi:hypothetical protein